MNLELELKLLDIDEYNSPNHALINITAPLVVINKEGLDIC